MHGHAARSLLLALGFVLPVLGHTYEHSHLFSRNPAYDGLRELHGRQLNDTAAKFSRFPEVVSLLQGNQQFSTNIESSNPGLLNQLAENGQEPKFMFLGCSDSRVPEALIFQTLRGTMFAERNIANQYNPTDVNSQSVLSYGITHLGVQHIMVVGHVGCGGVAAAIASPPPVPMSFGDGAVESWIAPVRTLFATSTRPEIAAMRAAQATSAAPFAEPEIEEEGFVALVEENVKQGVERVAEDPTVLNAWQALTAPAAAAAPAVDHATARCSRLTPYRRATEGEEAAAPKEIWVHGFVYDIRTGLVRDLNVSRGPPGFSIEQGGPGTPASSSESAATSVSSTSVSAAIATATGTSVPEGVSAPAQGAVVHGFGETGEMGEIAEIHA